LERAGAAKLRKKPNLKIIDLHEKYNVIKALESKEGAHIKNECAHKPCHKSHHNGIHLLLL
jgi:hypothetical protein